LVAAGTNTDSETYKWTAIVLRTGMYLSFAAMGGGLLWWLLAGAPGGDKTASRVLPLGDLIPQLLAGNPLALLNLGVLLLLATPGVTLITTFITYVAARNWRYAGISALVSIILLLSLAVSAKWIKLF
jgi:uncharacterized membrane protein